MSPMNYRPEEKIEGQGRAEEGEYTFKVDQAEEKTFNSGNEGCEVVLMVAAFPDRDITVWERFVYVPKALWKLDQFFAAIGEDFANPPEAYGLIGKTGKAYFEKDEKGYLRVAEYLPAAANNGPDTRRPTAKPAAKPVVKPPAQRYRQPGEDDGPPPHGDDECPL